MGGRSAAQGLRAFLGSVRAWSCHEGGSLPGARRPELVPSPAGGFPGPGNRWRVSQAWDGPLLPSPHRLPELSLPPPRVGRPGLPRCLLLLSSKADSGCSNVPQPLEELSCRGPCLASLDLGCWGHTAWECHSVRPGPSMAEGSTGGVLGTAALTAPWQGAAPASWRVSQAVRSCLSGSVHPDDVQVAKVDALLVEPRAAGATPRSQVGASGTGRGHLLL